MSHPTVFTIKQRMSGGDFTGDMPDADPLDASEQNRERRYHNLTEGGLFKWPRDKLYQMVRRVIFDLKDASSWKLSLVTKAADGQDKEYEMWTEADFSNNLITVHGRSIFTLGDSDRLKLVTTGVSSGNEPEAEITLSRW